MPKTRGTFRLSNSRSRAQKLATISNCSLDTGYYALPAQGSLKCDAFTDNCTASDQGSHILCALLTARRGSYQP